jgi:hypothetical protein
VLKNISIFMFLSFVSTVPPSALADEAVADVKTIASVPSVKIALNDVLQLQKPASSKSAEEILQQQSQQGLADINLVNKVPQKTPVQRDLLASLWLLGVALSLFVLRASRRKV